MKAKANKKKLFESDVASTPAYISTAWRQHIELMVHLCQFSQNVLLVVAPTLGGKTTFLSQFTQTPVENLRKIGINVQADAPLEMLMQSIATGFSAELSEEASAFEVVQSTIERTLSEQETIVLLIDNAHLLTDEQLQVLFALIKFDRDPKHQLHLVLFGNSSLEQRLFSSEFSSAVNGKIYTIELEPWTLHDVRRLFAKELTLPRLTAEQINAIFERSNGIPGIVLREYEALVEQLNIRQKMDNQKFQRWKKNPMILGALIGILAGGVYLMVNQSSDEDGQAQIPVNMAQKENALETQENPEPTMSYHAPNMDRSDVVEADAHEHHTHAMQTVKTVNTDVIVAEKTPLPEEIKLPVEPKTPAPTTDLNEKEQYLLSRNAANFTVQLLSARNESNVKAFIKRHKLSENTAYFRTKLSGNDWYVIVYGEFPSLEAAQAAVAEIPETLQKENLKPKIREMSGIHQDIRKFVEG